MNRLLLQECLEELHSDDPEWLCESQRNPKHRKKGNSPRHKDRAAPLRDGPSGGVSVPRDSTASRIPVPMERTRQSIPNTTESVKQKIRRFKNGDIPIDKGTISAALSKLRYVFSLKYKGRSAYGPITTPRGIMGLRLSDHNAAGDNFEYDEGDFFVSIFIEGTIYPHVPTRIPYREFYFPNAVFEQDKMAVAQAIADIVSCAIETGEAIDKSGLSIMKDYPVEISKDGTPIQAPPQGGQPPTPPATPPTGPGVQESLAAKYFKEAHSMKYRLLKEAALRELMEEDSALNEDWAGSSGRDRLGGDWKNMRYPEEIEQVIKNEVSNHPYSSFCDPPDAKGTRQKRFSDELEHNRWVATASNYELLRAIINPDDVSGEVSRRIDNFGGNPAQYTAKHELIKRALSGDETAKKMVEYMKKALDKQGRLSRLDALTLTH